MKRAVAWLLLLSCAWACTGCVRLPGEEYAFVVVLAVDRSADGTWQAWARIPNYQEEGSYETLTASGRDAAEAINDLGAAAPMNLHFGQLRMIVIESEVWRDIEWQNTLADLTERFDLRIDAIPAITREPLEKLMEAMIPETGKRLSKSLDILAETRILQGVIPDITLRELILFAQRTCPIVPGISVTDGAISLSGAWAWSAGTVKYLLPNQMKLLALMDGQLKRGALNLDSGTLRFSESKTRIALTDDQAACDLSVRATEPVNASIHQALHDDCLELLSRLYADGFDVLHLSEQMIWEIRFAHADDNEVIHNRLRSVEWTVNITIHEPT